LNVLVTGGTGTLGRHVVMLLRQSGHRARILSRNPRGHVDAVRGDLATGANLAKAVDGMDAIVHAASAAREPLKINAVDVEGTRRLIAAARAAGVRHLVYVSIVGVDRVRYRYYAAKLRAENVVREDAVPWSVLRATQFHGFVAAMLRTFARLPAVVAVPVRWHLQPVDAGEVARRVVDAALGEPSRLVSEFGGPEVCELGQLAQMWMVARHDRRRLVNLPLPLRANAEVEAGNLTCPDHRDGAVTFQQFLDETYPLR
jgi:uncharacterized protein YbjT (DUF2867 family)